LVSAGNYIRLFQTTGGGQGYQRPILQFPHYGGLQATSSLLQSPLLKEIWETKGAQGAFRELLGMSQREQVEYGMVFYRDGGGEIGNSPAVSGGAFYVDLSIAPGAVATAHTHWASHDGQGNPAVRGPSPADISVHSARNIPGMIINWDGKVYGFGY
jgi:hypothetical protein